MKAKELKIAMWQLKDKGQKASDWKKRLNTIL